MSATRDEAVAVPVHTVAAPEADESIVAAVRSAMALHGPSLLFDAGALREILQHETTASPREVALMLEAQALEVPQQLLGTHDGQRAESTSAMLAARLVRAGDMAMSDADWAVTRWARILRIGEEAATGAAVVPDCDPVPIVQGPVDAIPSPLDRRRKSAWLRPSTIASSGIRLPIVIEGVVALLIVAALCWFNFFRPALKIDDVTTAGKLLADGAAHDVTIAFEAHRAAVGRVEVATVGGAEAQRVFDVDPRTVTAGRVGAGMISLQSDEPRKVTYRYVLVASDGTRSPPFDKTFDFVPGPPRPPVITAITVPPDLTAGKPFTLGIAYEPGSRGIAQVEMRVASSTIPWTSEVVATPWVTSASTAPNAIRYPFEAGLRPSRTTLDFTMIDQDGVRSEPQRVVLDVRKPTDPTGCTRTTCGRVVTTREIEPAQGVVGFFRRLFVKDESRPRKVYEVVVTRDDGTTHVLNDTTRWSPGARVRIVGNRVSLRCIDASARCI